MFNQSNMCKFSYTNEYKNLLCRKKRRLQIYRKKYRKNTEKEYENILKNKI